MQQESTADESGAVPLEDRLADVDLSDDAGRQSEQQQSQSPPPRVHLGLPPTHLEPPRSPARRHLDLDAPPAAPVPAPIDLHPPPSPRQRTLDLDEPVGALSSPRAPGDPSISSPIPNPFADQHDGDDFSRDHDGRPDMDDQDGDGSGDVMNESELTAEDMHTPTGGAFPRDRTENQNLSTSQHNDGDDQDPSHSSSLFVHLGAQAPESDAKISMPQSPTVAGPAAASIRQGQSLPASGDGSFQGLIPGEAPPLQVADADHIVRAEGQPSDGGTGLNLMDTDPIADVADGGQPLLLPNFGPSPNANAPGGAPSESVEGSWEMPSSTDGQNAGQQQGQPQPQLFSQEDPQARGLEAANLAEKIRQTVGGPQMEPGPKVKPKQYAFPSHADADTLAKEIEEFYSYVETPQSLENRQSWEEWFESQNTAGAADAASAADDSPSESKEQGSTKSKGESANLVWAPNDAGAALTIHVLHLGAPSITLLDATAFLCAAEAHGGTPASAHQHRSECPPRCLARLSVHFAGILC